MAGGDPVCVSLILCDQVIEDAHTHNKSLIGTFNMIASREFPALHPRMCVVVSLTNCRKAYRLQLEITKEQEDDDQPILTMDGDVRLDDPNAVLDLVFRLEQFPLPEEGMYRIWLRLLPERRTLAQRCFVAQRLPHPERSE